MKNPSTCCSQAVCYLHKKWPVPCTRFTKDWIRAINMFTYIWDTSQSLLGHCATKDFVMTRCSPLFFSLCYSFMQENLCRHRMRHRKSCVSSDLIITFLLISNEKYHFFITFTASSYVKGHIIGICLIYKTWNLWCIFFS